MVCTCEDGWVYRDSRGTEFECRKLCFSCVAMGRATRAQLEYAQRLSDRAELERGMLSLLGPVTKS